MKRWTVDIDGDKETLWWSDGQGYQGLDLLPVDLHLGDDTDDAFAALVEAVHDAGRLRSLAAELDSHLNREQKFTGAQVAVMLRAKAIA